ncbi:MAG TPA: nuclear transport factor 2 family protein [Bryobacteraceae bacterium]|jgi:ketosteroid isomerase-like protein|nr:nuclear transport factor 2 family protein [Bryobacteraceae bacterium]
MTKWILLLAAAAGAMAAAPDAKTEKEIMATMETYRLGIIHKDAAALSQVMSDDVTYTHSSNTHQDKAAFLESLKGKSITEDIVFKDLKVRVYGNTAVVVGDVDFHMDNGGVKSVSTLNVLHVLVKGNSGWQLVARQATKRADEGH